MIKIEMDTRELASLFNRLSAKVSNTRPAMLAIAETLVDSSKENFEVEGRPKWKNLAESTLKQRKKLGYTGPILQRTGLLKNSITGKSNNTEAIAGTNREYAAIQQFGGEVRKRVSKNPKYKSKSGSKSEKTNIPARPFLSIQKEDIEEAERILLSHILK